MPIYEYRCKDCQQVFEEWQKNFEEREFPCPVCGGTSHRIMSNTSFVLKGSGWYVTDYCNRSSSSASDKPASSSNGSKTKTSSPSPTASDTKPAASAS